MENSADISLPELRRRLRRLEHVTSLRLQKHIRRRHPPHRVQRRDLRRLVLHLLDHHPRPSLQIRLHSPQGRRQRRRWHFRSLLPPLPPRKSQLLPSCQLADEQLAEYNNGSSEMMMTTTRSRLKCALEKHRVLQKVLLVLALIGTCMVIGDGVLTPAISG